MWNPKRLIIKNLMSHVDTEYEFRNGKCVMIYGENDSDDGADSNGSGKSVMLEAITLCLTNEVSRDIGRDEFINENAVECFVSLELENSSGIINSLKIEKTIHRTKSAKILIYENHIHNKEMTSVNETNSRIFELIGLTKTDLLNFFLIGQDKKFSFLLSGDSEKKEIISRFSNTNFILDKVEVLKELNKSLSKSIEKAGYEIEKIEDKIDFVRESITKSNNNYEEEKLAKIQSIKDKISNYDNKLFENEEKVDKLKASSLTIKSEISQKDIDEDEIVKYNNLIKRRKKLKSDSEDYADQISRDLLHLSHLKDGEIECPNCSSKFILGDVKLEDIPKLTKQLKKELDLVNSDIETFKSKIDKFRNKKTKLESEREALYELKMSLKKNNNSISILNSSNLEYLDLINDFKGEIKKIIKGVEKTSNVSEKKLEISTLKVKKKEVQAELDAMSDEFKDNEFWIHHFGKKGFMTFLTNKSIKSIEGITNFYLEKINTNLQIQIDGFTELRSGDLSDKINISILRDGKSVGNYQRFSGGEKGRINICNIVGLQKLINMSCPNGGLNFLGLDEVFEGLDITGQMETVKILEEIGVTTLVVSHRSKPIGVENEIIIRKIGGISKIIK